MLRIERARKSSACTTGNVAVKLENERAADRSMRSDAVRLDLKPDGCCREEADEDENNEDDDDNSDSLELLERL
jgi:hypothetical protein